jgi:hypothetical protein
MYKVDSQIRYIANPHYWEGEVPTKHLIFSITPNVGWRGNDLAFVGLQLSQTSLNVRRDGEDQMFSRHLTFPIMRIGFSPIGGWTSLRFFLLNMPMRC